MPVSWLEIAFPATNGDVTLPVRTSAGWTLPATSLCLPATIAQYCKLAQRLLEQLRRERFVSASFFGVFSSYLFDFLHILSSFFPFLPLFTFLFLFSPVCSSFSSLFRLCLNSAPVLPSYRLRPPQEAERGEGPAVRARLTAPSLSHRTRTSLLLFFSSSLYPFSLSSLSLFELR